MEFSESPEVSCPLLISSVLKHRKTLKTRLSVLITHSKRKSDRSQKSADNPDESTDNAIKTIRRCIISLNFMSTFDMIITRARRKMYLTNYGWIT